MAGAGVGAVGCPGRGWRQLGSVRDPPAPRRGACPIDVLAVAAVGPLDRISNFLSGSKFNRNKLPSTGRDS